MDRWAQTCVSTRTIRVCFVGFVCFYEHFWMKFTIVYVWTHTNRLTLDRSMHVCVPLPKIFDPRKGFPRATHASLSQFIIKMRYLSLLGDPDLWSAAKAAGIWFCMNAEVQFFRKLSICLIFWCVKRNLSRPSQYSKIYSKMKCQ
jgi:hypothetical protein